MKRLARELKEDAKGGAWHAEAEARQRRKSLRRELKQRKADMEALAWKLDLTGLRSSGKVKDLGLESKC